MSEKTIFELIAEAGKKANAHLILIGGFAVNEHGYARSTQDVDFLIREEGYPAIREALASLGLHEVFRNDLFARFEDAKKLLIPLDILFLDPVTFAAVWGASLEVTVRGVRFRIPSLEHLIALKLHAIKQGGERREWKDLTDVLNLVLENRFDPAKLKTLCEKFGPSDVYEMILKKKKEAGHG